VPEFWIDPPNAIHRELGRKQSPALFHKQTTDCFKRHLGLDSRDDAALQINAPYSTFLGDVESPCPIDGDSNRIIDLGMRGSPLSPSAALSAGRLNCANI
jgi:hypothetical protein